MRHVDMPYFESDKEYEEFWDNVGVGDNSWDTLVAIDRLLQEIDLQLVMFDGYSDYVFKIESIKNV